MQRQPYIREIGLDDMFVCIDPLRMTLRNGPETARIKVDRIRECVPISDLFVCINPL